MVTKGEIARFEPSAAEASESVYMRERVKESINNRHEISSVGDSRTMTEPTK